MTSQRSPATEITQMRSYRSVAMPETCPRIHLFGSGFGQNASTSNCGTAGAPLSASTGAGDERHYGAKPRDHDFHVVLQRAARSLPSPSGARVARRPTDYTASTPTTPGTALMAPAIWGETLKRPGSFTSTSVPSPSISTS